MRARPSDDAGVLAARQVLKALDKAWKSNRTYGATNPVARKFFHQLYLELTASLHTQPTLTSLVQRSTLLLRGQVVYETDQEAESLAFKLYAAGVRALTFHEGLTEEDLARFLEALWSDPDSDAAEDGDIVTRLWEGNVSTVTFVTAQEIMEASGFGEVLGALDSGVLNRPESCLQEVNAIERARQADLGRFGVAVGKKVGVGSGDGPGAGIGTGTGSGGMAQRAPGVVGYEVSPDEMAALAEEVKAESARDNTLFVLEVLTAILMSERSTDLLTEALDMIEGILGTLIKQGDWKVLNSVRGWLQDTQGLCPDLAEGHKDQVSNLLHALTSPDLIREAAAYLNRTSTTSIETLLEFIQQTTSRPVPALCTLLSHLHWPTHRAVVRDALAVLAKDEPEPVIQGLTDQRDQYVQDLLVIVRNLNDPRLVKPLDRLVSHPNRSIRKEALLILDHTQVTGDGSSLVRVVQEDEGSMRLLALSVLAAGHYTTRFSDWAPVLTDKGFLDRTVVEKRATYKAMRRTAGEESLPYWEQLITKAFWIKRKKKEGLAVLAAAELGELGSRAAMAVLQAGTQRWNRAIRQACTKALARLTSGGQLHQD